MALGTFPAIPKIPPPVVRVIGGALDGGPPADFAYGMRKLYTAYSGNAIQVRRTSDNGLANIGFDAEGDLDTVALQAHCSGTDGYIRTWYDQSGNGRDMVQTTSTNQYKIVTSGVVEVFGAANRPSARVTSTTRGMVATLAANYQGSAVCAAAVAAFSNGVTSFGPRFLTLLPTGLNDVDAAGAVLLGRVGGATPEAKWSIVRNNVLRVNVNGSFGTLQGIISQINGTDCSLKVDGVNGTGNGVTNQFNINRISLGYSGSDYIAAVDSRYCEVVGWFKTLTTAQQEFINLNQAKYFKLANENSGNRLGPLDIAGMPAASGAYSHARRLRAAYAGSAFQIQRATDDATADIGFDVLGNTDEAAITAFCGASDGFVRTLYDQSGAGRDMTQTDETGMWRVYAGATASVVKRNGVVVAEAVDETTAITTGTFSAYTGTAVTACLVGAIANAVTTNNPRFLSLLPTGQQDSHVQGLALIRGGTATPEENWKLSRSAVTRVTAAGKYAQLAQLSVVVDDPSYALSVDGSMTTASAAVGAFNFTRLSFGFTGSVRAQGTDQVLGELIFWQSALTSNQRLSIESDQRNFFHTPAPVGDQFPDLTGWQFLGPLEPEFDKSYAGTINGVPVTMAPRAAGLISPADWGVYGPSPGTAGVGTRRPENVTVQNGFVRLIGKQANNSCSGMSGYPISQKYGRWDIKARSSTQSGYQGCILLWPQTGKWPDVGEIDIFELPDSSSGKKMHTTLHIGANNRQTGKTITMDPTIWHVFTCIWEATAIIFYLDGVEYYRNTDLSFQPPNPMWLGVQCDIGPLSGWLNTPPAGSQGYLEIDWVRVYRRV